MTDLVIHGHFYQPPRENPWTGSIDREDSAQPFHDWNERIHAECYRPNALARVVDPFDRVERLVNNYAHLNFNIGPTLFSWIERNDPSTYRRILEADAQSLARLGHGNAIAQAYNHPILPLCNERDRLTQVRWGIADFVHRFRRRPESLWLPETACDDATLGGLIDEGLSYVILSPNQAERVRPLGSGPWHRVANGSIDPGRAYRYFHRDGSGRSLALFFYDGPIAQALAFEGALASSQALVHRLAMARGDGKRLVHVATDGETYGHHTRFGERGLAYAALVETHTRGFRMTNYASYLEHHPPTFEVELKGGEGTAWSCAHGLGRWSRDCGCQTGGQPGWNQAWRAPLRGARDFLRDQGARHFSELGADLFEDPWRARDGYIEVVLEPRLRKAWLEKTARRRLDERDSVKALTLLELQRNAMLMYTSCGWFFTELSGIETVQVLKYAARTLDFFDELGLPSPREGFLERLGQARSNLPEHGTGADIFRRMAEPSRVVAQRVGVSLAISSLVDEGEEAGEKAGYTFRRSCFRKERNGRLTMATGRLELEHAATGRQFDYARLSLHLGGVDFYCALSPFSDRARFDRAADALWSRFNDSSIPQVLRLAREHFGPDEFGLESVLEDSRRAIAELVHGDLVSSLTSNYVEVYRQNERIIQMLEGAGMDLPPELRAVAEFALTHQLEEAMAQARASPTPQAYAAVVTLARRAARQGRGGLRAPARALMERLIAEAIEVAIAGEEHARFEPTLALVEVAPGLGLGASIERAQEAVFAWLEQNRWRPGLSPLAQVLRLSPRLSELAADEAASSHA